MTNPNPVAPKTDTPATQIPDDLAELYYNCTHFTPDTPMSGKAIAALIERIAALGSTLAAERAEKAQLKSQLAHAQDEAAEGMKAFEKLKAERASRLRAEGKGWNDAVSAAIAIATTTGPFTTIREICALSKPSVSSEQAEERQ